MVGIFTRHQSVKELEEDVDLATAKEAVRRLMIEVKEEAERLERVAAEASEKARKIVEDIEAHDH